MEKRSYSHLTYEERCQIYKFKTKGMSAKKIALKLDVHVSTIYRELQRGVKAGSKNKEYNPRYAMRVYKEKRALHKPNLKFKGALKERIVEKLNEKDWSPDQISGRLKLEDPEQYISAERIYKNILEDRKNKGKLYKCLRRYGRKKPKSASKNKDRGIIGRVDIEEREEIVEKKERIGDWEADLVCSPKGEKYALVTMVDRASKYTKIGFVTSKEAYNVKEEMIALMAPLADKIHTITFDNGREFVHHQAIADTLNAKTYFAKPYHSWERGLNEHTNGLIRQYFPKKSSFQEISRENIQSVENNLNNRPRKVLGYRTPHEVFCLNYPTHYLVALQP